MYEVEMVGGKGKGAIQIVDLCNESLAVAMI